MSCDAGENGLRSVRGIGDPDSCRVHHEQPRQSHCTRTLKLVAARLQNSKDEPNLSDISERAERFCRWFLRFSGYFSIENFVVHASDDSGRISGGIIAPVTETDLLALRMPHSVEVKGALHVANFEPLVGGATGKVDVVIGEVKTGDSRPNPVWRANGSVAAIEYLVRFIGLCSTEEQVREVATELRVHFRRESVNTRYRYVIFCHKPNEHYRKLGVQHITFSEMIRFLVEIRGQSWINANIGVASVHYQIDFAMYS